MKNYDNDNDEEVRIKVVTKTDLAITMENEHEDHDGGDLSARTATRNGPANYHHMKFEKVKEQNPLGWCSVLPYFVF